MEYINVLKGKVPVLSVNLILCLSSCMYCGFDLDVIEVSGAEISSLLLFFFSDSNSLKFLLCS